MQQGESAAGASQSRRQLLGMTAFERHKRLMADYVHFYGGRPQPQSLTAAKTDYDILKEHYRFIRSEEEDSAAEDPWAVRLARRYYAKLYREYAIVDLSRYQESKVGMRWRSEKEVIAGKGQFICAARGCEERRGLATFEVPFSYEEAGEKKQALVKVRVCPEHAQQLNYRKNQEALRAQQKSQKRQERREDAADGSARGAKRRRDNATEKSLLEQVSMQAGDASDSQAAGQTRQGADAGDVAGEEKEAKVVNVWKEKQPQLQLEASKEDEFDQYLSAMFL